ncbi:MAG: hypothetical protein WA783_02880 [Phormidesmis sp.]
MISFLKKGTGYLLVSFGGLFLLVAFVTLLSTDSRDKKLDTLLGSLVIGIPSTAWGSGLIGASRQPSRRQKALAEQRQLQQALYLLIQSSKGRLTPIQFAIAANISIDEAEDFLNHQAKSLDANFEVTDSGALVYLFPVS